MKGGKMPKIYPGLVHLNGNIMAAVDLETTGLRAGYHEPIQIAVVPLDSDFSPLKDVRPFYMNMAPQHPKRADKRATGVHRLDIDELVLHAPDPNRVADLLEEWWQALDLPFEKTLVPLAHNWPFEASFLRAWLGPDLSSKLFHGHARDGMTLALAFNDRSVFRGEPVPFPKVGLGSLCKKFGILNPNPHDALCDAIAEAEVYRAMLQYDIFSV